MAGNLNFWLFYLKLGKKIRFLDEKMEKIQLNLHKKVDNPE